MEAVIQMENYMQFSQCCSIVSTGSDIGEPA